MPDDTIRWGVELAVDQAIADSRRLEQELRNGHRSFQAVNKGAGLATQSTRGFGHALGATTPQMRRMTTSGALLAQTLATGRLSVSGMTGAVIGLTTAFGPISIALGLAAAAIAFLIKQHKAAEEAAKEQVKAEKQLADVLRGANLGRLSDERFKASQALLVAKRDRERILQANIRNELGVVQGLKAANEEVDRLNFTIEAIDNRTREIERQGAPQKAMTGAADEAKRAADEIERAAAADLAFRQLPAAERDLMRREREARVGQVAVAPPVVLAPSPFAAGGAGGVAGPSPLRDAKALENQKIMQVIGAFDTLILSLGGVSKELQLFLAVLQLATQVKAIIDAPSFQSGGVVPGPVGRPRLAVVHGGEEVIPVRDRAGSGDVFNIAPRFEIHAVDAAGVDRILEQHSGTIARQIAREAQRSSGLRRRLSRR